MDTYAILHGMYSILHGKSFYPTWTLAQSYIDTHSTYPILHEHASNINIYPILHRKSLTLIPSHMKRILLYMDSHHIIHGNLSYSIRALIRSCPILHGYSPHSTCISIQLIFCIGTHVIQFYVGTVAYPTWTSNHTLTLIPSYMDIHTILHAHLFGLLCVLILSHIGTHPIIHGHPSNPT